MRETLLPKFGRYQVAEPPHALLDLHVHNGTTPLREVDHEPKVAVLDQEDLLEQGIHVSQFIPSAKDVDALGSCTANATTAALSNLLSEADFSKFTDSSWPYRDTVAAEKAAIRFYHECTDQTGNPGQEWPPTDCGSSGPYIVSELKRLGLASGQKVAHGAQNIVSLLQGGCILQGTPWLNAWMEPDANGFVDGDGSLATLQRQIQQGVAGGHETVQSAIEKLTLLQTGVVDPYNTVIRVRNSWSPSLGDNGSCRFHLSTFVVLGGYCDFRQLVA